MKKKKVYVSLTADLFHAGHLRILLAAAKLGEVVVGLLTSDAVAELGDVVYMGYKDREEVLKHLGMVSKIVPQKRASYRENILELEPDFVVHGDDWANNFQKKYRKEVIDLLRGWGGELVEVPYSSNISDRNLKNQLIQLGVVAVHRLGRLRYLLKHKKVLRILEAHNALSALIAENMEVEKGGEKLEFDGIWSSSLTDSTAKGKPDIEAIDMTSRIHTVNEIFEVTTKPMIFDADTGGKVEHFEFTVKSLERTGVSAVVIEDKTGLKKNSLLGNEVEQKQDTVANFCRKIEVGKRVQESADFMIIARVESLILGAGLDDAILRSRAYVRAGADGIMIHSRKKDPGEIRSFMRRFRADDKTTPVVVVPTSFNGVKIEEFEEMGVNVVITANHMLRAAYPAMVRVAKSVLENGRSLEAEPFCLPIKEILELIPGTK